MFKDKIYLVTLTDKFGEEVFYTFCKGTAELAFFILNCDTDNYLFESAEVFAEDNKVMFDFKEFLKSNPPNLEMGNNK